MIETTGSSRLLGLRALFPADVPNAAVLHGVLSGASRGPVLLDDADRPAWCVVKAAHYGFTFAGGRFAGAGLAAAIDALRRRGDVSLVVRDGESWQSIGAPPPDAEIARWEFSGPAASADDWARRTPDGCDVRRIDAETLPRCRWRTAMAETFGSAERYLAESAGTCLVRGDEILAEAHAAFWAPGVAEIGAITSEGERRRGLATVTAARLVQECRARGAEATWTCDQDNLASTRVALKLGFARQRPYRLLDYLRPKTA